MTTGESERRSTSKLNLSLLSLVFWQLRAVQERDQPRLQQPCDGLLRMGQQSAPYLTCRPWIQVKTKTAFNKLDECNELFIWYTVDRPSPAITKWRTVRHLALATSKVVTQEQRSGRGSWWCKWGLPKVMLRMDFIIIFFLGEGLPSSWAEAQKMSF